MRDFKRDLVKFLLFVAFCQSFCHCSVIVGSLCFGLSLHCSSDVDLAEHFEHVVLHDSERACRHFVTERF